jgi:hypothetical protein
VPETEVARCAGHGVAVLLKICVQSIDALDSTEPEPGPGGEEDDDSEQAA